MLPVSCRSNSRPAGDAQNQIIDIMFIQKLSCAAAALTAAPFCKPCAQKNLQGIIMLRQQHTEMQSVRL